MNFINLGGGGYSKFKVAFAQNKDLFRFTLYITDLDRACNLNDELRILKSNITTLVNYNKFNNVFLSYPEIETFIMAAIDEPFGDNPNKDDISKILSRLGYSKGKGSYKFYRSKKGDIETAKRNLKNEYFYLKTNDKIQPFNSQNLGKLQSSLTTIFDYLNYTFNELE